ncbi:hypothetical protein EDD86DRAFT_202819 [Gorgonomyces haynaldii]|nr:hypothetical protein EDD86DRAFT_202819 [Gorgonomyces haynaldii]
MTSQGTAEFSAQEPFTLKVHGVTVDSTLEPYDGKTIQVHYQIPKDELSLTTTDSTFFIKGPGGWFSNFALFNSKTCKVTVQLPADLETDFTADFTAGKLKCQNLGFKILKTTTTSGDAIFNNIRAGEFSFSAASGDLIVSNSQWNKGTFKSLSGDSKFNFCRAEWLTTNQTSGDITLTGGEIQNLDASFVSGDCKLENTLVGSMRQRMTSGDVRGSVVGLENFAFSSISGDLNLNAVTSPDAKIKVEVTSGDVKLNLDGFRGLFETKSFSGSSKFSDNVTVDRTESRGKHKWAHCGEGNGYFFFKSLSGDSRVSVK